jgi:hypothetical protein
MVRFLKTLLINVPGVQPRLVSVLQTDTGFEIICGGTADPYLIAEAIFEAVFNYPSLQGSIMSISAITNAAPGQVTTVLNHGLSTGTVIRINGAQGISGVNGIDLTITVIDEKNFTIGIDTTSSGAYTGGGVVTPNPRNQLISIYDYPNAYEIPFVIPPQQTVSMTVVWNTSATNIISDSAVSAATQVSLATYVNSIAVGQPINDLELAEAFLAGIADIVPPELVTRLLFTVSINGIVTAPDAGFHTIDGDPESYFQCDPAAILVNRA